MWKCNERTSLDVLKLKEYFKDQPNGSMHSFVEIEQATGVATASPGRGRSLCTRALRELGRPCILLLGYGIELTTGDNAHVPALNQVRKAIRAGHRVDRISKMALTYHEKDLGVDAKKLLMGAIGFAGACRAVAADAPKLLKK